MILNTHIIIWEVVDRPRDKLQKKIPRHNTWSEHETISRMSGLADNCFRLASYPGPKENYCYPAIQYEGLNSYKSYFNPNECVFARNKEIGAKLPTNKSAGHQNILVLGLMCNTSCLFTAYLNLDLIYKSKRRYSTCHFEF